MYKITHKCKENNQGIPDLIYKDSLCWNIEAGDGYHDIYYINYCPFCGVKLD